MNFIRMYCHQHWIKHQVQQKLLTTVCRKRLSIQNVTNRLYSIFQCHATINGVEIYYAYKNTVYRFMKKKKGLFESHYILLRLHFHSFSISIVFRVLYFEQMLFKAFNRKLVWFH